MNLLRSFDFLLTTWQSQTEINFISIPFINAVQMLQSKISLDDFLNNILLNCVYFTTIKIQVMTEKKPE